MTFKEPINVGELVTFRASVNHAGRTSMEVGIRVEAEAIRSGTIRHTNSCYFTMVAVDDDRPPRRGAQLSASTRPPRPAATAPPNCAASSAARSPPNSSAPRRERHERVVLGRNRPVNG